ncbi:MAG TPA: Mur ligase family protein [Saprospiraceae bacterium]|nr:Mur ligase family protein [Saprospiraceae bacterium]
MNHIHFISIGGNTMHSIALELQRKGYHITGSDDEIYNPSYTRLKNAGLLPDAMGWDPDRIHKGIDAIILGMHARIDNPELIKAIELSIPVYSYPEFLYRESRNKKRVVVAGSHGKTTTTAMVMTGLASAAVDFDYMVGAPLAGFDKLVHLSDAPLIVMEGDEYLSSPIDRRPKIHHYHPHVAIITGIAWDHINVFKTFDDYQQQFSIFMTQVESGGHIIYNEEDEVLIALIQSFNRSDVNLTPYRAVELDIRKNIMAGSESYPSSLVGRHNYLNMGAALACCKVLGIAESIVFQSMSAFQGASKRLQVLVNRGDFIAYLDYAHAPSKVTATVKAIKDWYNGKKVYAILELHTYSSLNKDFIPLYRDCFSGIDHAVVFYNEHTIAMKKLSPLNPAEVRTYFGKGNIQVITRKEDLRQYILDIEKSNCIVLLMSSGHFEGLEVQSLLEVEQ